MEGGGVHRRRREEQQHWLCEGRPHCEATETGFTQEGGEERAQDFQNKPACREKEVILGHWFSVNTWAKDNHVYLCFLFKKFVIKYTYHILQVLSF
jgi:hypothetical protein